MAELSQIRVSGTLYDIKDAVARMATGSPAVAATASAMTDPDKVYVYTGSESGYTNGNWYYYDGSSWVSGGVYNSAAVETDTSLSVSGKPADAKVTGDSIKNLVSVGDEVQSEYTQLLFAERTTEINVATSDELNTEVARLNSEINNVSDYVDTSIYDLTNRINANVESLMLEKVSDGYVEDGVAYFTNGDDVLFQITGIGGGGGGGGGDSGNNAVLTVSNTSGWISKAVSSGESVSASFTWSSIENDMPTGAGTMTVKVNGATKISRTIQQGEVSVDLTSYLGTGSNNIRISVSDVYNNIKNLSLSVSVVLLTISSPFDDSLIYSSSFDFPYTPTGSYEKIIYFKVDGTTIGTATTSASGRQASYTIPAQSHGAHTLECYFTAQINGETVESNHLLYSFIYAVTGNTNIIISSAYDATTTTPQYSTLQIPFVVYNPSSLTTDITLKVNGVTKSTQTVGRAKHTWTYRCDAQGSYVLSINADGTSKSFTVNVTESEIDVEAETNNLALYLTAAGRSNNESDPSIWGYNNISATLSNFNYASDGWKADNEGNTVLRVTGDARVEIPYKIFQTDFRSTGKTIEFDFEAKDVRNYDTVLISCWSGNRGVKVTAQATTLKSAGSEISTQFKDNEHVRVSFVVEKRTEHRLIYCYINGIVSGVVQYPSEDDFAQQAPVNISIGSNDATIDIYCIRVYDNDLTRYQMLNNWIADTQSVDLMLERYNHNNVFDDYGQIVISKLPNDLPYMILEGPELPQSKGDKKTVSGSYTDPQNPSNSFTFTGAQIDVQGTSSQYYARKNYKVKFKYGFDINGENVSTYAMRGSANSVPTNTFTFKADVASSEGANNVELARLYDEACPYKTPGQQADSRVRQGIDGFPMVIFWNNGTKTVFLGKYNFNNDKGTEEVFGFQDGDESWEIKNNTSNRVLWRSTDYTGSDWLNDFEARYPDTDPPYTDPTQLSAMATWIYSTLNNPTKFKQELAAHMEVNSVLFYYLFTELFLMVDSRAKNAFPSFMGGEING